MREGLGTIAIDRIAPRADALNHGLKIFVKTDIGVDRKRRLASARDRVARMLFVSQDRVVRTPMLLAARTNRDLS